MKKWFALQVYCGRERWIGSYLASSGFDQLVLLQKDLRQWSDRRKIIETPVFPGYVFCLFNMEQRGAVLSVPGVHRVVGLGRTPEPVAEEEIAALKRLDQAGCPLERWPYLREGDLVRIEDGPLCGLTGHFVEARKSNRIVVSITLVQRSVAVEIGHSHVRPIQTSAEVAATSKFPNPASVAARSASLGAV